MQHVAHRGSDEVHQLRLRVERLRDVLKRIVGVCSEYEDKGQKAALAFVKFAAVRALEDGSDGS